jgi:hypothetical protein
MPVDCQQLHNLLQRYQEIQAKREKYQQQVEEQRRRLAGARASIRQACSASQAILDDLDANLGVLATQESYESSSDSGHDPICPAPPPSVAEDPISTPVAPSKEVLVRFATTVAYSSYSRLCGTSDDCLIDQLVENDPKDPSAILGPKKMIEIPQAGHNIVFLRREVAAGAPSLFATSMIQARRRVCPEVGTDDQIRRLGPADLPEHCLPIYWIITFSQNGVLDWQGGCDLARAYRRVFEDFGVDDVHCLVFECEADFSSRHAQKAYAME